MELGLIFIVLGIAVAMLVHGGIGLLMILVGILLLLVPYVRREG